MGLTKERMLEIEKIVQPLLADIDFDKTPCVDIVPLVRKEGIDVVPKKLDIRTTGYIQINDNKEDHERTIAVNTEFINKHHEEDIILKKSRFITAHEYGHFILHRKKDETFYAHRDTDNKTDLIELEADYFARSLLMPFKQFKIYFLVANDLGKNDKGFVVEVLSKMFRVTTEKVKDRIKDVSVLNRALS